MAQGHPALAKGTLRGPSACAEAYGAANVFPCRKPTTVCEACRQHAPLLVEATGSPTRAEVSEPKGGGTPNPISAEMVKLFFVMELTLHSCTQSVSCNA